MKILIIGISGYVGKVLLPYLLRDADITSIVGLDIKEPDFKNKKLLFFKVDIRSPEIAKYINDIDVVVHLAFIVTEIKDKKLIHSINVNGTKNLLDAVEKSNVKKLIIASSIAAYGSHPDNPKIITEDTPLRGNKNSYYSHTKFLMEKMLDDFEKENKNIIVTRLRPSILCGPDINNPISNISKYKILFHIKRNTYDFPIIHQDDAAKAFYLVIKKDFSGAFNITAGNLSIQEMSDILNVPAIGIPYFIVRPIIDFLFKIGMSSFSSHWVVLGRYPVVVSNEKAKKILGWYPKYNPVDAFKEMVKSKR